MAETTISTTADMTDPPNPAADAPKLLKEWIPSELHEKPYLKDWLEKPQGPEVMAEVFKKLDGAQALIGKKSGVPGADATDKDWEDFHAQLRPEKVDAYEILTKEGETPDEEFVKTLKEAFHAGALTPRQAKLFQGKFMEAITAKQTEATVAAEKLDKEFDELVKVTFGADSEKVLARANAEIKEHTPENLKAHIPSLDNKALTILSGVITSILTKYASEDTLGRPGGHDGGNSENLREESLKIMASPEYKDPFNPKHDEARKRLTEVMARRFPKK